MGAALRDDYRGWLSPSGRYPVAVPDYEEPWDSPEPDAAPLSPRITQVRPTGFDSAREIGEHVRVGTPVIMDLTQMADPDAKRLIDFASGLVFGTRGTMERIARRVFLLAPPEIEVMVIDNASDGSGFYNQS
ncbi:cell division protein SepF [Streptacidiphilus jiangxiensis]|jgi:cell division inhibitor SepF|uniref:Cell division protein SepF n=1 Tax=Streptacidiphilus jiangxiensis TaxID=235985 RepID=A0A1H7HUD0_STRJI|nr:cell division protein SepF [Streptacidiphilus jiangxiensis]SEK53911.1 cell division inhibitor SepF [Streptacidiphilus jiangxiensis]